MKKKILVAGGNQLLCGMLECELMFASAGSIFKITRAANGCEARDKLREAVQSELPDLVVIDSEVPGLSGINLLRFMRTQPATDKLAVIMVARQLSQQLQHLAKMLDCECFRIPADISLFCRLIVEKWQNDEKQ